MSIDSYSSNNIKMIFCCSYRSSLSKNNSPYEMLYFSMVVLIKRHLDGNWN